MTLKQLKWQKQVIEHLLEKSVENRMYQDISRFTILLAIVKDSIIEWYERKEYGKRI